MGYHHPMIEMVVAVWWYVSDDGSSAGSDSESDQEVISEAGGIVWRCGIVGAMIVSLWVIHGVSSEYSGVITGVVSGIVVRDVPNNITRPRWSPTLSSDDIRRKSR
ncbi:hypothetical protein Tco_0708801 [Tanacetum coccineum]